MDEKKLSKIIASNIQFLFTSTQGASIHIYKWKSYVLILMELRLLYNIWVPLLAILPYFQSQNQPNATKIHPLYILIVYPNL